MGIKRKTPLAGFAPTRRKAALALGAIGDA
jgi:hypothetical protein